MAEPKYAIIINDIKRLISDGTFKPGEKIYSEDELKKKYNISNTTVVRALHELVRAGILARYQGKGTYVSKSIINEEVIFNEYTTVPNGRFNRKTKITNEHTKVVAINEIQDARIAKKLQIPPENMIVHFQRIRLIDDVPWTVQNNYMAKSNLINVDLTNFERFNSLSEVIKELYGINILHEAMKERIEVEFPVKDKNNFKLLEIDSELPLYHIERITYVPEGQPYEYIESYLRHNFYSIEIEKKKQ
ncbi:GntR family transcriptional regulator [Listeria monocytogenes]|nr:GntR family transcriptional regulator [Listeria monocytogenes]